MSADSIFQAGSDLPNGLRSTAPSWPRRTLLRSPQHTLHPKLPRLLPLPIRWGWGEGLLGVVYPAVLAVRTSVSSCSTPGANNFGACYLAGTAGHARRFNNKTKKDSN